MSSMLFSLVTLALAGTPQGWSVVGGPASPLVLRATPADNGAVVTELAPGTTGLVELAHQPDGWVKVRSGAKEGWARDSGLVPVPPADGKLPSALRCSGTEPFWGLELGEGKARAVSPDRPDAPKVDYTLTNTAHGGTWLVTPRGKGAGYLWLVVRSDRCSDGMSDVGHAFAAEALTAEAGFVTGCCRLAE